MGVAGGGPYCPPGGRTVARRGQGRKAGTTARVERLAGGRLAVRPPTRARVAARLNKPRAASGEPTSSAPAIARTPAALRSTTATSSTRSCTLQRRRRQAPRSTSWREAARLGAGDRVGPPRRRAAPGRPRARRARQRPPHARSGPPRRPAAPRRPSTGAGDRAGLHVGELRQVAELDAQLHELDAGDRAHGRAQGLHDARAATSSASTPAPATRTLRASTTASCATRPSSTPAARARRRRSRTRPRSGPPRRPPAPRARRARRRPPHAGASTTGQLARSCTSSTPAIRQRNNRGKRWRSRWRLRTVDVRDSSSKKSRKRGAASDSLPPAPLRSGRSWLQSPRASERGSAVGSVQRHVTAVRKPGRRASQAKGNTASSSRRNATERRRSSVCEGRSRQCAGGCRCTRPRALTAARSAASRSGRLGS